MRVVLILPASGRNSPIRRGDAAVASPEEGPGRRAGSRRGGGVGPPTSDYGTSIGTVFSPDLTSTVRWLADRPRSLSTAGPRTVTEFPPTSVLIV